MSKSNNIQINDDMLVKYLVGEANAHERLEITQWIQSNENNRKHYEHFRLIWERSRILASTSIKDEELAWQRLQGRIKHQSKMHKTAFFKSLVFRSSSRIAASILVICAIGLIAYYAYRKSSALTLVTVRSHQQILTDTLPDGSVITLNKNSSIAYNNRFTENTRPVSLQGEAFFKVTPDKTRPFIIKVNDVTVKVVGTSFNVKARNGRIEVIVETGIVQVNKQAASVQLKPGEKAITGRNVTLSKQKNKSVLYNYYRTHELVCNQTPLSELVITLNEAYDTHIVIVNPSLKALPITTVFKNQSLEQILIVITETFKIHIQHKDRQILLR